MNARCHRVRCLLLGAALLLAGCERPPVDTVQRGYRGTGMVEVYNPRALAAQAPRNAVPGRRRRRARRAARRRRTVFKNVQVLGDLSVGRVHAR